MAVPIYIITGFLDSGKTSLIKESMEDPEFSDDNFKTLIIQFEEGEESFSDKWLEKYNCSIVQLDSSINLDLQTMQLLQDTFKPQQIFIEYNGLESLSELITRDLLKEWVIVQILTTIDASTFLTYMNNMKSYMYEITKYSNAIIFNRVDDSISKTQLRNNIKVVNREAQIVYINKNGEPEEFTMDDLPFDINSELIDINDNDYGLWYMDAIENIENYNGKDIRLRGMFMEKIPGLQHSFILGRLAMVCCADDMQPIGITVTGVNIQQMKLNNWYEVVGTLKMIDRGDNSNTLVIYAKNVKTYDKPEYELVSFS
ncbi:MAG: hypothetical protein GX675_02155 [Erysipelotrichaceae bacterium]|nr:hypothetical protein [Erysipelotrichaceae bacterium]